MGETFSILARKGHFFCCFLSKFYIEPKPLKDHLAVIGHKEAFAYAKDVEKSRGY